MFLEILNKPWLGEVIFNKDLKYNVIMEIFVIRVFKIFWIETTRLEEQYIIGGLQNYLNKKNLIRRRICY